MKKCSKCGKVTINDEYSYCTRCGTTFNTKCGGSDMAQKIFDWKELAALDAVPGWKLEVNVELGGAHLNHEHGLRSYYFSTHTFYNKVNATYATTRLRAAGYDVRVVSEEDVERKQREGNILHKQ